MNAELPYPHTKRETLEKLHRSDAFARAFGDAQYQISYRTRVGYIWPLLELREDRTEKHMKVILDFINPIVNEALKSRELNDGEGLEGKESQIPEGEGAMMNVSEGETLLSHLVKETTDKKIIIDETLNMLVAGTFPSSPRLMDR